MNLPALSYTRPRHVWLACLAAAVTVFLVSVILLAAATAGAANNYNRSITLSTSQPSASSTYTVNFTVDSSYSLSSFVVDFCSNSPLVGQDCTAPSGFTVGASPNVTNLTINGSAAAGTWTASSANSGRTLLYSGSGVSVAPGDVVSFTINGVTNPNSVGSFYGRILTYSSAAPAYSATDTDVFAESGSAALSTATSLGFLFQVPESLNFCVYKTTCGDVPAVVLGHGTQSVLDNSKIDTDTARFSISTNAQYGAIVTAYGSTPTIASRSLSAINGGNGVQATMVAGTEAFGYKISPTTGDIAPAPCYVDSGGDDYCFNNNQAPPSTTPVTIAEQATPGPINSSVFTITFAATASTITPAGNYQTTMNLLATATF